MQFDHPEQMKIIEMEIIVRKLNSNDKIAMTTIEPLPPSGNPQWKSGLRNENWPLEKAQRDFAKENVLCRQGKLNK